MKIIPVLFLLIILCSCSSDRKDLLDTLVPLEGNGDQLVSGERIAQLEEDIKILEETINTRIEDTQRLGTFYKTLAVQFMDLKMYGPALENLEKGIIITPENPILFYRAGLCAAQLGKNLFDPQVKSSYFSKAEFYYKNAIRFRSNYADAHYALAILYYYELDRAQDAEDSVNLAIRYDKTNAGALFVRASLFIEEGRVEEAVNIYNQIIELKPDTREASQAETNKEEILERLTNGEF